VSDVLELERALARLSSLFATAQRLGEACDRREVLDAMSETLASLVGTEAFAVFELAAEGQGPTLSGGMGLDAAQQRRLMDATVLRDVLRTGRAYIAGEVPSPEGEPVEACFPLRASGEVVGAVVIVELLPQKLALEPLDRELFTVLEIHGGRALACTAPPGGADHA
jgi:hypothetical protein